MIVPSVKFNCTLLHVSSPPPNLFFVVLVFLPDRVSSFKHGCESSPFVLWTRSLPGPGTSSFGIPNPRPFRESTIPLLDELFLEDFKFLRLLSLRPAPVAFFFSFCPYNFSRRGVHRFFQCLDPLGVPVRIDPLCCRRPFNSTKPFFLQGLFFPPLQPSCRILTEPPH